MRCGPRFGARPARQLGHRRRAPSALAGLAVPRPSNEGFGRTGRKDPGAERSKLARAGAAPLSLPGVLSPGRAPQPSGLTVPALSSGVGELDALVRQLERL